jgi:hypothetical protein
VGPGCVVDTAEGRLRRGARDGGGESDLRVQGEGRKRETHSPMRLAGAAQPAPRQGIGARALGSDFEASSS